MLNRPTRKWLLACGAALAGAMLLGMPVTLALQDAPAVPPRDFTHSAALRVRSIVNGRVLLLEQADQLRRVQLLGVETGDSDEAAERCLREHLAGEWVYLEVPPEPAERGDGALVYRAPDGLFINLELIRQGFATTAPRPHFAMQELFQAYERRAKSQGRGLWKPDATPASRPASQPASRSTEIVYVTPGGKRYHRQTCSFSRNAKPMPLTEAVSKGYEACSRCKPPRP